MSDLSDLYQEVILDHNRRPRNFGKLEHPTHHAEGYNPLCGDKVDVYVDVEEGKVRDIRFEGSGCAISTASASLMTEALKGKSVDEALALFARIRNVLTGHSEDGDGASEQASLGKLAVLEGVTQYPLRVKCATLAWHTLRNALENRDDEVARTE